MAESEADILRTLDEIRAELRRIEAKIDGADPVAQRLDRVETTLKGLTLAVVAGFGALVRDRNAPALPRRGDVT